MSAFPDHFSERAAAYARRRPGYPTSLRDLLAEAAPRRGVAWDAGCGSGQLTVLLAQAFRLVLATDPSRSQISQLRPGAGVLRWVSTAESSGIASDTVDLAVAAQAAHWFRIRAYYHEVRRVARPGAALALVSYGMATVDDAVDPVVRRFYERDLGPHWPRERRHVERGYRSLPFPFREMEVPRLELEEVWTAEDFLGYVRTWSAARRLDHVEGPRAAERSRRFRRHLISRWGPGLRTVRWPLSIRLGRVD